MYDINHLKSLLGNDLCSKLLFVHAFTGCDTTSRIFGVGKKLAFQKLVKGEHLMQSCANAFTSPSQTSDVIENLGIKMMAIMYGGKYTDSLESLRCNIFSKKVVSAKSFVTPERLPPTASSTKFHCLRVYYQIMVWIQREHDMDPLNWGWKREQNQYVPIMTEMNAAPENLLKMIHCNCSTACSTPCCSCRRHGLPCTAACGLCQLESCDNLYNQQESDNDEL